MPFCTECGKENDNESAYCMHCGAKLLINKPLSKEEETKQQHQKFLTIAYEKVIEKFGGRYEDWYYVNFVKFTRQNKSSIGGTTNVLSSSEHVNNSGGLIRIHANYLEFIQISDDTSVHLFDKQKERGSIDSKFIHIETNYIKIIPFKNITYSERGKLFLDNGQSIGISEITLLSLTPKIELKKPPFLKNQKEYHVMFIKAYKNYLGGKKLHSNADEIKKLKELLDDGVITEYEFIAFKNKLLE